MSSEKSLQEVFLESVKSLKLRFPVAEITKKTGYKSPIVSEYLNNKKPVSEKFFKAFCEAYNLDAEKLMKVSSKGTRRIPIVGEAAAGTDIQMAYHDMDNSFADQYIDVGDLLRDSEAAFVVYGNSMTPAYPPGCILGIRRNYDRFIQPGETYLLVTKSNRVFKRLFYSEDQTKFICYSDNTMMHETGPRMGKYAYPPFEVEIEKDVIQVYDVIGMIKRNRPTGIISRPTK